MKVLNVALFILVLAAVVFCQPVSKKKISDLVLLNGSIWTVNAHQPWAEAVAIQGEKIIEVGSNQEIEELIGEQTHVIDLEGKFVLPGFCDSHTHFLDGGFSLSSVQLKEARTREDFVLRIQKKAQELDKEEWILNGNWDHQQFDPPVLPSKEWIDGVTPQNPVFVNRHDGHMVLVNSLALKLAGITKNTPFPAGGEILKDPETGEPTGILKDSAMDLVMKNIPQPSIEEKIKAAETALRHARRLGVTSIHDMSSAVNFEIYQRLYRSGSLTARLVVYMPITDIDIYDRLRLKTHFGNDFLKIGGLKGFVDGSLGSSTALFFEPYTDQPEKTGLLFSHMYPEGIMKKRLIKADKTGLQVAIHAIGDKANRIILDIFKEIISETGERDRRWRIEHAQHLTPEDFRLFGKLNVIASVQPYHAIDDGCWAEKKIGKKRAQYTYAFKSLIDNGAVLACGSDWYVAPLDPIKGIFAAVTRQTLDGNNPEGWIPEQKISLEEAIKGYTLNGAYAEFSEHLKGSIEKGKLADLVVLSHNLFEISPEKIQDAKVLMMIFNGNIVYNIAN